MSTTRQTKNTRRHQEKPRRAKNMAPRLVEGLHSTNTLDTLRVKYPDASSEALAFMSKAYANPAFRDVMQDLADR